MTTSPRPSTAWREWGWSTMPASRARSWNWRRAAAPPGLVAKGVDRESARAAMAELDDPGAERARAEELARGRAARMAGLPSDAAYRRLVGFLARRGYAPSLCRDVARRALAVDPVDDPA